MTFQVYLHPVTLLLFLPLNVYREFITIHSILSSVAGCWPAKFCGLQLRLQPKTLRTRLYRTTSGTGLGWWSSRGGCGAFERSPSPYGPSKGRKYYIYIYFSQNGRLRPTSTLVSTRFVGRGRRRPNK